MRIPVQEFTKRVLKDYQANKLLLQNTLNKKKKAVEKQSDLISLIHKNQALKPDDGIIDFVKTTKVLIQ